MTKHTAAPWLIGENRYDYDLIIRSANNDPVCSVIYAGYSKAEAKANARLIAAAPDLLEELKDLCGAISSINASRHQAIVIDGDLCYWQREEWVRWVLDEILPHARAVIDKATGDQS